MKTTSIPLALALLLLLAGAARAAEPLPPIQKAQVGPGGAYTVNGKPFLVLGLWLQTPRDFALLKENGFNAIAGYWWDKTKTTPEQASKGIIEYAEAVHKAGLYYIAPYEFELEDAMKKLAATDYLLGWTHDDEPDMPRKVDPNLDKGLPAGVKFVPRQSAAEAVAKYQRIRKVDPTRPVDVGFTACFMARDAKFTPEQKKQVYSEFAKAGDSAGFDTYPIFGSATPGRLLEVAEGVTELRAIVGPDRGLLCAIECNKGSKWVSPAKQLDVKPEHTRFETWSALIRGATGIAYFTHKWKDPDGKDNYMTFAPKDDPAMLAELKRLNGQLARLAPAILAPDPRAGQEAQARYDMRLEGPAGKLPSHYKLTILDGSLYIFAQNLDLGKDPKDFKQFEAISPRAGKATFTVGGLKAGTKVEVVDENRTIAAHNDGFADEFGPLAEHVYRIAAPK
jgi:hypothetical protein